MWTVTSAKLSWSYVPIYRVSQEECARLREGVPYVKVYRYNPKHLCPKLNGYGDNDQRKVCSSCGSTHCTCQLTILSIFVLECGVIWRQFSSVQFEMEVVQTINTRENILQMVQRSPRLSTRRMASRIGVSRMQVWRTLHEENFYAYMIKEYNIWNQATMLSVWIYANG